MTLLAPAARSWPGLGFATRHWRGFLFLGLVATGFQLSLRELAPLSLTDTPVGYTPFVPLLAIALAVHLGHRHPSYEHQREPYLDFGFGMPFLALALYLMYVLPGQQSWYFWLHRHDLLALGLFSVGLATMLWGTQAVLRLWPAFVYLLLLWPFPVVKFQAAFGPALADLSAATSHFTVALFGLPMQVSPGDAHSFVSLVPGHEFTFVIGEICSGMGAFFGFLVVAIPIAIVARGAKRARVAWVAAGAVLALVSNLVRLSSIFLVSARDPEFAIETLHPFLGVALLVVTMAMMLLAMPVFEIRPGLRAPHGDRPFAWEPQGRPIPRLMLAIAFVATAAVALGAMNVRDLAWFKDTTGLPAFAAESPAGLLPAVDGRELEHLESVPWANLFGADSESHIAAYSQDGGPDIVAQLVVTADSDALDSYSIERCDLFHGASIDGVDYVELGHGVTAKLVNSRFGDDAASTLYWVQPVQMEGALLHARIALILYAGPEVPPLPAAGGGNAVRDTWLDIQARLGRYGPAGDATYGPANAHLALLGGEIVDAMVARASVATGARS